MFIEEMGKTGVTTLLRPNMPVAARMTAGDQVSLQRANSHLAVQTLTGEQVGEVEPKLGQRLLKLMDAGNEYVAAIQALDGSQVKVFIRETFQHASQTGKLSFPPTVIEQFRPYAKGRLVPAMATTTSTSRNLTRVRTGMPVARRKNANR
jgi:hypothetical protein